MKKILIWSAIVVLLLILPPLIGKFHHANYSDKELTYFYQNMTAKNIRSVEISGEYLEWDDLSGNKFQTAIPPDGVIQIVKESRDNGATVKFDNSTDSLGWPSLLASWLPLMLNIGVMIALTFMIISIIKLRHQTANPSHKS